MAIINGSKVIIPTRKLACTQTGGERKLTAGEIQRPAMFEKKYVFGPRVSRTEY